MKHHFYLDISEQRPRTSQYTVLPLRTGESLFLWVSMSSSVSDVRERHHSCSCYFAACYALIHEFHRCAWVLCGARVCAKPWEYKRNWSEAVMSVSWRQIQQESFHLDGCQLHGRGGITESTGCWAKWSWWSNATLCLRFCLKFPILGSCFFPSDGYNTHFAVPLGSCLSAVATWRKQSRLTVIIWGSGQFSVHQIQ